MAVSAPPAGAARPRLPSRIWPRIRRFVGLRLVLVVIAVLGFAYLILEASGRFVEATVWQVPLVLELLVLSVAWRAISAKTVATFFFIGFGPVFAGTVIAQVLLAATPLHGWLGSLSSDFLISGAGSLGSLDATIWAPITEEIGKIVPVVLLLWWGRRRLRAQVGPLDVALLAAATGAGMGAAEDLFQLGLPGWATPESPLLGLGVGTAYLALIANPLGVFELPIFAFDLSYQGLVSILDPSVEQLRSGAVWAGHGVLPMLVGLGLGFALLARRRIGRLAYVLPAVLLLWAIWDHFVANWYSTAQCGRADEATLCGLARLDLTGGLFPLAAIAGWVAGMLVSRRTISRYAAKDPALALRRSEVTTRGYRGIGWLWPLYFLRDLLRFYRMRSRTAFGWGALARASGSDRARLVDAVAATRLEAAVAASRLRGQPTPAIPAPLRTTLDRIISRA